jgi:hypothetical protein
MSAWSHLPNAAHIDRVIASVGEHPEVWSDAYFVWAVGTIYDAAWDAAWDSAWDSLAWDAVRNATRYLTQRPHHSRSAARDAILALAAYDDCEKYLSIPSDQLRVWTILSENPAAVLLLPAVIAFERIGELEMA